MQFLCEYGQQLRFGWCRTCDQDDEWHPGVAGQVRDPAGEGVLNAKVLKRSHRGIDPPPGATDRLCDACHADPRGTQCGQQVSLVGLKPGKDHIDLIGPAVARQFGRDVTQQRIGPRRVASDGDAAEPLEVQQHVRAWPRADRDEGRQRGHSVRRHDHGRVGRQKPPVPIINPRHGRRTLTWRRQNERDRAVDEPHGHDVGHVAVDQVGGEMTQGRVEPVDIGRLLGGAQIPLGHTTTGLRRAPARAAMVLLATAPVTHCSQHKGGEQPGTSQPGHHVQTVIDDVESIRRIGRRIGRTRRWRRGRGCNGRARRWRDRCLNLRRSAVVRLRTLARAAAGLRNQCAGGVPERPSIAGLGGQCDPPAGLDVVGEPVVLGLQGRVQVRETVVRLEVTEEPLGDRPEPVASLNHIDHAGLGLGHRLVGQRDGVAGRREGGGGDAQHPSGIDPQVVDVQPPPVRLRQVDVRLGDAFPRAWVAEVSLGQAGQLLAAHHVMFHIVLRRCRCLVRMRRRCTEDRVDGRGDRAGDRRRAEHDRDARDEVCRTAPQPTDRSMRTAPPPQVRQDLGADGPPKRRPADPANERQQPHEHGAVVRRQQVGRVRQGRAGSAPRDHEQHGHSDEEREQGEQGAEPGRDAASSPAGAV